MTLDARPAHLDTSIREASVWAGLAATHTNLADLASRRAELPARRGAGH